MKIIIQIRPMKHLILLIGIMLGVAGLASAQTATPRVNQRQKIQTHRIEQGARSGQLTRPETRRLSRQERKIKLEKKAAKSDGTVTPNERRKITGDQNAESRRIYRAKHNGQKRPE